MTPKTRRQKAREDLKTPKPSSQKIARRNKRNGPLSDMRKEAHAYWKAGNLRRQRELKTVEFQRSLQAEMDACKKRQAKKEMALEKAHADKLMSVVEDADVEPCYVLVEPLEVSILEEHPIDAEQLEMLKAVVDDFNDSRLTLGLDEVSSSETHDVADIEQDAVVMANKEAAAPKVPVVAGGSSPTQDPHPLEFLKAVKQEKSGHLLYMVKDLATGKHKRITFTKAFKDAPQAWAEFAHKQLTQLVDDTS